MADENKRDPKALVAAVLGGEGSPRPPRDATEGANAEAATPDAENPTAAKGDPREEEVDNLIAVYFELEEPAERDALFEELIAIDSPGVLTFLRAMMQEDDDEYLRAAAAAELARRGVAEGLEAMTRDLEDPPEPFFFNQAVQVLAEVLGAPFYETLHTLWHDPNRDADQRREAMVGLESIDPPRALADFVRFIEGLEDFEAMADDQVEVALMAFVRHQHADAKPPLQGLRQRLERGDLDEAERRELVGLVDEGLALL